MGFFSFFKGLFSGRDKMETELDAARARHGVKLTEAQKAVADKTTSEQERFVKDYDVWDDLKNYRTTFWLGSWVTRKFRPVGEDKVKKKLEELEKKRREKEAGEKGEG